jgi:hypothetical protein
MSHPPRTYLSHFFQPVPVHRPQQRVCQAVGQLQELEVVKVRQLYYCYYCSSLCAVVGVLLTFKFACLSVRLLKLEGIAIGRAHFAWVRIKPEHLERFAYIASDSPNGAVESPPGSLLGYYEVVDMAAAAVAAQKISEAATSDNPDTQRIIDPMEYVLTKEDVGHIIGVRYIADKGKIVDNNNSSSSGPVNVSDAGGEGYRFLTLTSHGEVAPGPPRLLDFCVTGSMKVSLSVSCVQQCLL